MDIRRIVPEIRSSDLDATKDFYMGVIGLELSMEDEPSFLMLSSATTPSAQLVVNDNAHRALPPGLAIDVGGEGEVDRIHLRVTALGLAIVEPLTTKPWGIRRFSVIDPDGTRVTIIGHVDPA